MFLAHLSDTELIVLDCTYYSIITWKLMNQESNQHLQIVITSVLEKSQSGYKENVRDERGPGSDLGQPFHVVNEEARFDVINSFLDIN